MNTFQWTNEVIITEGLKDFIVEEKLIELNKTKQDELVNLVKRINGGIIL